MTLWRWTSGYDSAGVAGLIPAKTGPKGPSKLTEQVAAWIRDLDGQGLSLAAIAARSGVSTATVRVALGRRRGSAGWEARQTVTADAATACGGEAGAAGGNVEGGPALPVLPMPRPRTAERELARTGLLPEAPPVFTEGAHLPLAGLLLILPALAVTGLVEAFEATYGRLRNGFYGLRATLLMLLFLALLRDPRAEGATRIRPADLGRLLGLDRAPEVKTLRRKLIELAGHGRGAQLQSALAKAHAAARPQALGFLHVDGHVRVYSGTRDLPKTHIARMHLAGHATNETWIADADADPVLVVTAPPAASLAAELVRLLPDLRNLLGPDRRATVIFDRGGWSPDTFAKILAAGMDVLTYRKAPFDRLGDDAFTEHTFTDPDGDTRTYQLARPPSTCRCPTAAPSPCARSTAKPPTARRSRCSPPAPTCPPPNCAGGCRPGGGKRTTSNTPGRTSPSTPWTATPTPPTTPTGPSPTPPNTRRKPPSRPPAPT